MNTNRPYIATHLNKVYYKNAIKITNDKIRYLLTKNKIPYGEEYNELVYKVSKSLLEELVNKKADIIIDSNFANKNEYKEWFEKKGYQVILIGIKRNDIDAEKKLRDNLKIIRSKVDFEIDEITTKFRDELGEFEKLRFLEAIDNLKMDRNNYYDTDIYADVYKWAMSVEEPDMSKVNFIIESSDFEKEIDEKMRGKYER
jgi:hypothetical protein